jgi:hypothetical protein
MLLDLHSGLYVYNLLLLTQQYRHASNTTSNLLLLNADVGSS